MNRYIEDENLSLKAKGIMSAMLMLESKKDLSMDRLLELSRSGRNATYSGIKELKEAGYVARRSIKDDNGKFVGQTWDLSAEGEL